MQTNNVSSQSTNAAATTPVSAAGQLNSNDFLKLLVTQLQNQDPLNPVSGTEFASQLAQFSTLAGIQELNTNFTNLLLVEQLAQGANLVGRTVIFNQPGISGLGQGVVQAVQLNQGQLQLVIDGLLVPISQVQGIQQTAA